MLGELMFFSFANDIKLLESGPVWDDNLGWYQHIWGIVPFFYFSLSPPPKAFLPCHQVQVSFSKPSLLGSRRSKTLEIFFHHSKLVAILSILVLVIILSLF